ncbi:MAG TPA: radical SAM protein [Dehalococcoidia bacterium]|nr:radical SAM protein [Dehalococcoidia bacterium]
MVYGPVPSRRLGHSLGINNIFPKICSYSCVYCQLGNTVDMRVERETFYKPEEIAQGVKEKLKQVREKNEPIDYLTFVSDGEPTLDANLGREIGLLKSSGMRVAVITNASLIWREDVRQDLQEADWVSLKVDAVSEEIWRRINRPQKSLKLGAILDGMLRFADSFKGELTTESMLIQGRNDNSEEIEGMASFLAELRPDVAYLAIPTRPPAERTVTAAGEQAINMTYQIFSKRLSSVEYLIGYEGNAFAFTGNAEADLLSITSVHPMREEAVIAFLKKAGRKWVVIDRLIKDGSLVEVEYQGRKFYMRKLPQRSRRPLHAT